MTESWRVTCADLWRTVAIQRAGAGDLSGTSRAFRNRQIMLDAEQVSQRPTTTRYGSVWR